jgi:hypothetical protein
MLEEESSDEMGGNQKAAVCMPMWIIYVPGNSGRESLSISAEEVAASFKTLALFGLRKPPMHLPQLHLDIVISLIFYITFCFDILTETGFKPVFDGVFVKAPCTIDHLFLLNLLLNACIYFFKDSDCVPLNDTI